MTSPTPEAVVFDVGGVLVESPFESGLRWKEHHDIPDEVMMVMFREYAALPEPGAEPPMWHRVEVGELSLDDFMDAMRAEFSRVLPPGHRAHDLRAVDFNVFENAGAHWQIIHEVRRLREQGVATAILTNNVKEWADWRRVIPLDWFDVVVDSCEVGLRKPDPEIWRLTLGRLGVPAERAVFLDDHPLNVAAARALGMTGIEVGSDLDSVVAELRRLVPVRD
ncbi:MAG TPA: HAD family phosphatase [Acidimicrobiales bacterium]|nr:HAD family phosphatase [Acidimicrobiales bacterium]